MSLRIRRARPTDVLRAGPLIEPDRPLFSAAMWRRLPSLLVELLETGRILLCVVEETDPQDLRFIGGSVFLNPALRDRFVDDPIDCTLEAALHYHAAGGTSCLNRRQIAEENSCRNLILLNFFGTIDYMVARGASAHEAGSKATSAWTFFHQGFGFREILLETATAAQAALFRHLSARCLREHLSPSGQPTWQFQITADDASHNPVAWPYSAMVPAAPRFNFTRQQQQVLELALLDFSDREIVSELDITDETLKKRWRAIYRAVEAIEPTLLARKAGADLRRALLQSLRHNLVELRPHL
jgi:hypothetical protein